MADFEVNGITYKSAEHWMMAKKAQLFDDKELHEQIINAKSPGEAKDLGRTIKGFDEEKWKASRCDIVIEGNYHKFSQHAKLERIEFIGICVDGSKRYVKDRIVISVGEPHFVFWYIRKRG